jgi:adenylylsulfate kinase
MSHNNTGFTVWLTGMSCTGKSSLANYIAARLHQVGRNVEILDENAIGEELWAGIGDTKDERVTVMRRLGFVGHLLTRNNIAVLVASISPYKAVREDIRRQIGRFVEVYVDCPTEQLIQRDSSGRYRRALSGEIPNFIGITEPYEPPGAPEVTIHSNGESVEEGGRKIFQALLDLRYLTTDEWKVIGGGEGGRRKAGPKTAKRRPVPGKGSRKARPASRAARVVKASKKASGRRS